MCQWCGGVLVHCAGGSGSSRQQQPGVDLSGKCLAVLSSSSTVVQSCFLASTNSSAVGKSSVLLNWKTKLPDVPGGGAGFDSQ